MGTPADLHPPTPGNALATTQPGALRAALLPSPEPAEPEGK